MPLLDYRIIQFFRNPIRSEGKNIAILAFNDSWAGFKSIGMLAQEEKADLSGFLSIGGKEYEDCLWIFGEWIEWFKALCTEAKGDRQQINDELNALSGHTPFFTAVMGGCVEISNRSPESALGELFDELVGQPPVSTKNIFKNDIHQALERAEITFLSEFEKEIEVTLKSGSGNSPFVFTLDYYLGTTQRLGFKIIQFHGAQTQSTIAKVNDAIVTFSEAQKAGFLEQKRCIVLCDDTTEGSATYIDRLQSVATVIDVTKKDAHRKISRIHLST